MGDFNRDGIQDMVVAVSLNGSNTAILIDNGDGTFQPLVLHDVPTDKSSVAGGHIIADDFNRDGAENPPRDKNQG